MESVGQNRAHTPYKDHLLMNIKQTPVTYRKPFFTG
uniref:Uncharacterized protein n=1 Tax=Anguilla anguilla TaxID=7936 RepID=A0A0E9TA05_ANGAN